jgi:hypothetical protein
MVKIWPNIYVPSYFICLRKARLVLDTSTTKARLQTKTRQHHSDERPIILHCNGLLCQKTTFDDNFFLGDMGQYHNVCKTVWLSEALLNTWKTREFQKMDTFMWRSTKTANTFTFSRAQGRIYFCSILLQTFSSKYGDMRFYFRELWA